MNYAQLFQVPQRGHHLYREPPYQPVVKTLIIVHFDELIQVDRIEVKHKTQVVAPDEVIVQLDHSLHVVWVLFPQAQKKLGLYGGLIVVFLLVFDYFDGDLLRTFVVHTSDHIAESAFANYVLNLVPIANVVALNVPVVALLVVKSIVHESFQLRWLVLLAGVRDEPNVVKVFDLCPFEIGQVLVRQHLASHVTLHGKL